MTLSTYTRQALVNLVKSKMGNMEVTDLEDRRELALLERCRGELIAMGNGIVSLSMRSVETLIDLVEIKISYMGLSDLDERRAQQVMENCRAELVAVARSAKGDSGSAPRRRGRRPKSIPMDFEIRAV